MYELAFSSNNVRKPGPAPCLSNRCGSINICPSLRSRLSRLLPSGLSNLPDAVSLMFVSALD